MSIGLQLTPGTPSEISFAAAQGLPSSTQQLILIGHMGATGSATPYKAVVVSNVADPAAALAEVGPQFGSLSELTKMVVAAVEANQANGNFPPIIAIALAVGDSDHGQALATVDKLQSGLCYIVSPYDGNNQNLMNPLLTQSRNMWAPGRVDNGQFGSIAVAVNQSVTNPATLFKYDTFVGSFHWLRDTAPSVSLGEIAASIAAQLAANQIPFNPVKNLVIPNVPTPALAEQITVGAGLESESCLAQGWSPIRVLPNGDVAHVRARTLRVTTGDGVTSVSSYFDVMDFNVLAFWRKTLAARFNQPDVVQAKASSEEGGNLLSEVIRLANLFQTQGMFQNVDGLAKLFTLTRNVQDRSRFDIFTPVNVIPILAVVATEIQATTVGDTLTL